MLVEVQLSTNSGSYLHNVAPFYQWIVSHLFSWSYLGKLTSSPVNWLRAAPCSFPISNTLHIIFNGLNYLLLNYEPLFLMAHQYFTHLVIASEFLLDSCVNVTHYQDSDKPSRSMVHRFNNTLGPHPTLDWYNNPLGQGYGSQFRGRHQQALKQMVRSKFGHSNSLWKYLQLHVFERDGYFCPVTGLSIRPEAHLNYDQNVDVKSILSHIIPNSIYSKVIAIWPWCVYSKWVLF